MTALSRQSSPSPPKSFGTRGANNPAARACGEAKLATPEYKVEFIVTAAL